MPTVTWGSFILLMRQAIPADTKCAARFEMHSHTCRTAAMSTSVACDSPEKTLFFLVKVQICNKGYLSFLNNVFFLGT